MQVFIQTLCFLVLVLNMSLSARPGTEYHIVSSEKMQTESNCSHCITLSQFADDPTNYTNSNAARFKITSGNHSLNKEIRVSNLAFFSIFPAYDTIDSATVIICSNHSNFTFINISSIEISGLTLIGCVGNRFELVDQAILKYSKIMGKENSSSSLLIVLHSTMNITNVSFLSNKVKRSECNTEDFRHFQLMAFTFVGGTAGGALTVAHSTLTIDNCLFEENSANIGGAISSKDESNITISDSYFISNYAADCDHGPCSGGALFIVEKSTVLIQNCSFQNNTSPNGFGGVALVFNATLTVLHSYAYNSTSGKDGGMVAAFQSITLTFQFVIFNLSKAKDHGGALFLYKSNATINNSHFANNSAEYGGGITAWKLMIVIIDNCVFKDNSADHHGGAIDLYIHCKSFVINSTFTVNKAVMNGVLMINYDSSIELTNNTFNNNEVGDDGGVIFLNHNSEAIIKSCKFINNTANDTGGVISARNHSTINVSNSLFNACRADISGGCIYAKFNCNITVVDSMFVNNTSKVGGALAVMTRCTIVIKNCKFVGNIAGIDGGVLDSGTRSNVSISNCMFINNSAVNDGTLLVYDKSAIVLENSTFIGNTADNNGGVAYVYDTSNITIKDCSVVNSSARYSGGALYVRKNSNVSIINCQFSYCTSGASGGAVYTQFDSVVYIDTCNFNNSKADYGGAICVDFSSKSKIVNSFLTNNEGRVRGGAVAAFKSSIMELQMCKFSFNVARNGGAVSSIQNCSLTIKNSSFLKNKAEFGGAFIVVEVHPLNVISSTIQHNQADYGGAIHTTEGSNIIINFSSFDHNHARYAGGCIFSKNESIIRITSDQFYNNTSENDGGVLFCVKNSVMYINSSNFTRNEACVTAGVISLQWSRAYIQDSTFSLSTVGNIGGVIHARNASSFEVCRCYFTNNSAKPKGVIDNVHSCFKLGGTSITDCTESSGGVLYLQEKSNGNITQSSFTTNRANNCGGVILSSSSSEVRIADSSFHRNEAKRGAAIATLQATCIFDLCSCMSHTSEGQTLDCCREIQILNNTAEFGGAIYLSDSKLYFKSVTLVSHNQANFSGGGICAIRSSIIVGSTLKIYENQAELGGGISLEDSNSKVYDLASEHGVSDVEFLSNIAHIGGAVYINDESDSNKHVCDNAPYAGIYSDEGGCFFQNVTNGFNMNFTNNYANVSGDNLYGGLLDRCAVVADKNVSDTESNGIARLKEISNIVNLKTVSSKAVRVCLCNDNKPNCSQLTRSIRVKKGNQFTIPVVAIDQVGSRINSTIHSTFKNVYLPENQTVHKVGNSCTSLNYQISFPRADQNYELIIYPEGPCNSKGISNVSITIHVLSCLCPPGFMRTANNTECTCSCDERLTSFIKDCDPEAETVVREGGFWITYLNDYDNGGSSPIPYLIYPHCPLDYCQPASTSVRINLNLPNGSDALCANNRGGLLCGSCQPDYSLSLGSSKCIKCPTHSYGLLITILIIFFFAGILLVAFLFMLNLTVAIGTLNSIIFYANIIDANSSIYFRKLDLTFVPVLISWLNLGVGFDMCFFNGMDTYTKIWLQLTFPVYMILLVIATIFVSSYSSKFSKLLAKRDPVATLATVIFLSYTKLLEMIILTLSNAPIRYPNGTTSVKWLPDASVDYGKGKHIGLIVVGIIVLMFGLPFTILVFSWQWLIRCQKLKITRSLKFHLFINTYHTPHTMKHRYWAGLLLFVRVIVFLISICSVSADPRITLLSTIVNIYDQSVQKWFAECYGVIHNL